MDSFSTTSLDLLRHGECDGGLIFRGDTDSALTDLGQQQMLDALAPELTDTTPAWDLIVTSPRQRCFQVAAQLSEKLECALHTVNDFREISFGDWDGLSVEQVQREQPVLLQRYWTQREQVSPPNGEALTDFQQRVTAAYKQLLSEHEGKRLLVITHGGVLRSLIAQVLQMSLTGLQQLHVPHACRSQLKVFHQPHQEDWPQLVYHNRSTQ